MRAEDYEPFKALIEDLCAAFNRPCTDRLVRVFYETCKGAFLQELQQAGKSWAENMRKFPSPRDLMADKPKPVRTTYAEDGLHLSKWAVAANKLLFQMAYQDERRGFKPMGKELLARCLRIKADYVRMAEDADAAGEPMDGMEFSDMCREGFAQALGTVKQEKAA